MCEVRDRKIRPEDHPLALRGLPIDDDGDPEGRIFLSYPNLNYGFFVFAHHWFYFFNYLFQNKLTEVAEYAKMQFHGWHLLAFWVR